MSIEVCYGLWFGSLVFVTRERLDEYAAWYRTMQLVLSSDSWERVLAVMPIEEIESRIGPALVSAWWSQNPDNDSDRESGCLPPIDAIDVNHMAVYGGLDFLDASDADPNLPEAISDLATYPATSPMSGYDPWCWGEHDLTVVMQLSAEHGITLTDASALIASLSEHL